MSNRSARSTGDRWNYHLWVAIEHLLGVDTSFSPRRKFERPFGLSGGFLTTLLAFSEPAKAAPGIQKFSQGSSFKANAAEFFTWTLRARE